MLLITLAIAVIAIALDGLRPVHPEAPYDLRGWGGLPVLQAGRVKPLDTHARATLMQLRGKQSLRTDDGEKLSALQWLWMVVYKGPDAAALPTFRIDEPDIVSLLGYDPESKKYLAYAELHDHLEEIDRQFQRVNPEPRLRNRYERAIVKLYANIITYQGLALSFGAPGMGMPLAGELTMFNELVAAARGDPDGDKRMLRAFFSRYGNLAGANALSVIPPVEGHGEAWHNLWEALMLHGGRHADSPVVGAYVKMAAAAGTGEPAAFNSELQRLLEGRVGATVSPIAPRLAAEQSFHAYAPFYRSMLLYVVAFLLACAYWARGGQAWQAAAFWALAAAFVMHSTGLGARMYIHGRPPVTSLYSSAVFIGWAASGLSLIFERVYRNGMGSGMAAVVGFASLVIAHHLSIGADTFESMRAVLNDNFWLTTHVITITLGYSASFMGGFIALIFLLRAMFTPGVGPGAAQEAERMVYGVICFTLLFSFVGTVLGGIWADQSWGRFWGWDPKENGALLIVIWNALILHSYRCRLMGRRGLMLMAVSGNIVTSWSWFGTNMLGIGLHSYGFMDQAFVALMLFWLSQALMITTGLFLPVRHWRSIRALPVG